MSKDRYLPYFTFADEEMLAYLEHLNPLELKYNLRISDQNDPLLDNKAALLARLNRLEETYAPVGDRDDDADKNHKMLQLVYGEAEPIDQFVEIVHLVRNKLLTRLTSAEGLSNLFNCKYFGYEWFLHTELDDRKLLQKYTRDHFIHQVKDAYSMLRLLKELPDLSSRLLEDFMDSPVHVNAYLYKQAAITAQRLKDKKEWYDCYLRLAAIRLLEGWPKQKCGYEKKSCFKKAVDAVITSLMKSMEPKEPYKAKFCLINEQLDQQIKKELLHNMMIASVVMAGLFHDIGYPIRYAMDHRDDLADMIPTAHFFIESIEHFPQINGLLANSLLFKTVEHKVIKSALCDRVHGALSAVAFLLYFYESGAIQSMDAMDRAAIEVAGLSIFDHTLNYALLDDKKSDYRYYRSVFMRNPMSYLLRFVDDIQEWGRVYFNIETNRSLRICKNCRQPIVESTLSPLSADPKHSSRFARPEEEPKKTLEDIWARGSDEKRHRGLSNRMYLCGCPLDKPERLNYPWEIHKYELSLARLWEFKQECAEKGKFPPDNSFALLPDVDYRKINHMKPCLRIRFHRVKSKLTSDYAHDPANLLFLPNYTDDLTDTAPEWAKSGALNEEDLSDRLLLHIDYDPFKALQMTMIQPEFSKYRSDDLNKLRKLLYNQQHFASVAIYASTSNNPLILKVHILENFLNDWYARYAKAERLWVMFNGAEYDFSRSILLGFIGQKSNKIHAIEGLVEALWEIYDDVREKLISPPPLNKKRTPRDVLCLRIFMLLSENPRWSIDEIEGTPRGLTAEKKIDHVQAMQDELAGNPSYINVPSNKADREYWELYGRLTAVRYEPSRIILGKDSLFANLLQIGYAMRYHFSRAQDIPVQEKANLWIEDFKHLRDTIAKQTAGDSNEEHLKARLDFYAQLLYESKRLNAMGQMPKPDDDEIRRFKDEKLAANFANNALFGDTLQILLKDFFKQECAQPRYIRCLKMQEQYPESYSKTYEIKEPLINAVKYYYKSENYVSRKICGDMLDAHADMYMFYCISNS